MPGGGLVSSTGIGTIRDSQLCCWFSKRLPVAFSTAALLPPLAAIEVSAVLDTLGWISVFQALLDTPQWSHFCFSSSRPINSPVEILSPFILGRWLGRFSSLDLSCTLQPSFLSAWQLHTGVFQIQQDPGVSSCPANPVFLASGITVLSAART